MHFTHTVAATLVATAALAFTTGAAAQEADRSADVATGRSPVQNLFTSWFGGKAKTESTRADDDADLDEADMPPAVHATFGARASELVTDALGLIGISYRMGGSTPQSGFDCSGMVRYVFQSALGLNLPRRAEEISRVGIKIDRSELKPGDLVFYRTLRKTFSHVGIYLGNNRFIHAPHTGAAVRIDDMTESYWSTRFNGARRIDG